MRAISYKNLINAGQLELPIFGWMDYRRERTELIKNIVELKSQVRELEDDLIHDSLTKLKTRAFFEEEARVYLSSIANVSQGKRKEYFGFKNISFLFFDIDYFKKVNDTYGHDVGDVVLYEVANVILRSVRSGDTVARWGGEEMIALLLGSDESDAREKAEDIRRKIESMSFDIYPDLKPTISIGVVHTDGKTSYNEVIKCADEALYKAKQTGRNKVVTYSSMH